MIITIFISIGIIFFKKKEENLPLICMIYIYFIFLNVYTLYKFEQNKGRFRFHYP